MAPGPGGSPFRARWDATSVSLYSVVNEPRGSFTPSPCIPHFFRVWTKKISNFFCRKTVGTLSSLIIESKNIFCEIFFRTKKKQKKKTGSADSRRRTREAIRGATEKRAFSLLFFFCFSIYSFSCIVHIGGSW